MIDWQMLYEVEDHAYFMAELVDMSPESFTLEEKRRILDGMIESSTAIEDAVREARRGDADDAPRQSRNVRMPRPGLVVPDARGRPEHRAFLTI